MASLEEKIRGLLEFRDSFFEVNPSASKEDQKQAVRERAIPLLQDIPIVDSTSKAAQNLVSGRILNACVDYDAKCEEFLSRAVKLDPSLIDGWNELGQCLWKKGDPAGAKNCFQTAISKERNATSLRCLSMAMRQEKYRTPIERLENILKSLALAKEAVEVDATNGPAWYVLGNAYFTQFFACGQIDANHLDSAESAYKKALDLGSERQNPDLHVNYAMVLKYGQSYQDSLDHLTTATRLDPTFAEAKDMRANLISYLMRVNESVLKKGKLKAKRVTELLKSLNSSKDLGPFASGSIRLKNGTIVDLRPVSFATLNEGGNANTVVVGKVVGIVPNEDTIPYTFTACDESGQCVAVTVYNFAAQFGMVIGDSFACPEPFVVDVSVTIDDKPLTYRCIRVASPEILVRNGRKLGKEYVAFSDAKFDMLPE